MKNRSFWKGRVRSFGFALDGLKALFRSEPNVKVHLFAAVCVLFAGWYFHLSRLEWVAVVFAIGLVLITETINTALEYISDFICPTRNEKIKVIKDIAAASVLISAIVALIIGLLIFIPKLKLQ